MITDNRLCLAKIRSLYPSFSTKELKIADFILNDPQNIIHLTITQFAEELNVADSTVFRFCKRIGFTGYQSMKISLASEVVTPIKNIHDEITEADDMKTLAEKVFRSNMKTLEDTMQIIDAAQLEKAAQFILEANKIEFYGSGGSSILAMDAYHKFIRTGLFVSAPPDSHIQLMSASQLQKGDCAIFLSHSGSTKDMLKTCQIAKKSGAKTIAITNLAKSPLSTLADLSLYTLSDETDHRSEALSSRIAQLSYIDALYVSVMRSLKENGQTALEKMRNAISTKRI
ncbi:MurR/RpiR family transcriptional regulator [Jeotgalibacillus campisalis]|uniref:RpiR family transcriptional regulator n=1 Tax=Jeotgalibacillus campisalis TaxID=220754 RepID=A0A0C2R005_9BACL|nr:MurR/RpiR family transcriptional regulator [Jeotgalibacillus campisalis]KIL43645.1 RpiR family transcriptional regulator [Jeotgalibacillus campisalis]